MVIFILSNVSVHLQCLIIERHHHMSSLSSQELKLLSIIPNTWYFFLAIIMDLVGIVI